MACFKQIEEIFFKNNLFGRMDLVKEFKLIDKRLYFVGKKYRLGYAYLGECSVLLSSESSNIG